MNDERERFERAFELFPMPEPPLDRLLRRRERKRRNQRTAAGVVGVAVFASFALAIGIAMRTEPRPADAPTPVVAPNKFADIHGWIVYRSGSEIMAVDPANPQDTIALHEPSLQHDPIGWSPDGTQLLLADVHLGYAIVDLFVVHADGSRTELPSGDGGSFSPDMSMIAYAIGGADGGVYVMDADGGTPRLVAKADSPGPCGQVAAWSPDGSQIAFTDFQGPYGPTCSDSPQGVSFVNDDGTGLREQLVQLPWGGASGIAWSPDGSQLVLSMTGYSDGDNPRGRIYVVNADGSGLRQISAGGNDRWPAWSPDGTRIGFVRGDQLFTMAADGTDVQEVVGVSPEGAIAWNPLG